MLGYLETMIIHTVYEQERRMGYKGILPREVQAWLPISRAEGTLRRDMAQMWQDGLLRRIGGEGARRGYRLTSYHRIQLQRSSRQRVA